MYRKFHKVTWEDFETLEKRIEELALQRKLELRDELTKELASKADIQVLRTEMQEIKTELKTEMQAIRTELSAKIENEILKLDRKFTIWFIVFLSFLMLVNPNVREFLLKVLELIR